MTSLKLRIPTGSNRSTPLRMPTQSIHPSEVIEEKSTKSLKLLTKSETIPNYERFFGESFSIPSI